MVVITCIVVGGVRVVEGRRRGLCEERSQVVVLVAVVVVVVTVVVGRRSGLCEERRHVVVHVALVVVGVSVVVGRTRGQASYTHLCTHETLLGFLWRNLVAKKNNRTNH